MLKVATTSDPTQIDRSADLWVVPGLADRATLLAQELGIYLCPGYWSEGNERVSGLWGPTGQMLGWQVQTHQGPGEWWHLGDELNLIEVGEHRIGFLIGQDTRIPEVGRILARLGATLLIALPTAETNENEQLATTWAQVQQNQFFLIEASNRPAIIGPCELTADLSGFLAQGGEVTKAALDEQARQELLKRYDILGLQNPRLYNRYLPHLYKGVKQ